MATWQYDLIVIPRQMIERLACNGRISEEVYDHTQWWDSSVSPHDVAARIDEFLCKGDSWSDGLLTWGVEDGNRVDLLVEGNSIEELRVRIDMRRLSESFLQGIVDLAVSLGAVLVSADWTLVSPHLPSLAGAIAESDAARFVADPSGFLGRLAARRD